MTGQIHDTPLPVRDSWGAWDRFLVGHRETGFHQSSWWAAAHRASGGEAFAVLARRDGIIHGGGVVLCERWGPGTASYRVPEARCSLTTLGSPMTCSGPSSAPSNADARPGRWSSRISGSSRGGSSSPST